MMKDSAKLFKKMMLIGFAAFSLSLTACQKNQGSSSVQGVGVSPYWQNCGGCAGTIGQAIPGLTGVRSSTIDESVLFAFDLIVSQNTGMMLDWNNPKAILFYSGPASIQGVMRVTQSGGWALCGAPAGDYQIQPMNASSISVGGVVTGGVFQAVGPAQVVFQLNNSALYNAADPNGVSRNSASNRINLNLLIVSVNGMGCGPLVTR